MESYESEDDLFKRPPEAQIRQAWKSLFSDPLVSLSRLKAVALSRDGLGEEAGDGGITMRQFYHGLLPSPTSPHVLAPTVEAARHTYTSLRRRWLVAPDGRWASDTSYYENIDSPTQISSPTPPPLTPNSPVLADGTSPYGSGAGSGWDPLSLDGASPWKTWFAHQELRATIRQDVERTFPDIPYFRIERVRTALTTALFILSVMDPDVGYRQGMHELLAVCLLAVDRDSLPSGPVTDQDAGPLSPNSSDGAILDEAMRITLDRRYVEHDAFGLFQEIMRGGKAFYEWRGEEGPRAKTGSTPQAPILVRCQNLHNVILRRVDPQLWERFETEGLEPQIWAMLIFTRELPLHLALRIWDGVFAEDPGLGILDYICVAMLLLIRNELVNADYSTLLTNLLRYPSPSVTYPFQPHLILSQAMQLRSNPTAAGGVDVVLQNHDLLGVSSVPPEGPPTSADLRKAGRMPGSWIARGAGAGPLGTQQQMSNGVGVAGARVQGLAAGLFERAQAAGLDQRLLSTVADIRKNLPDAASAYSYLPNLNFSPSSSAQPDRSNFSSIPSTANVGRSSFFSPPHVSRPLPESAPVFPPVASRPNLNNTLAPRPTPPRQPSMDSNMSIKSLRDAEREVAELKLAMMGMGKAMAGWMEALGEKIDARRVDGPEEEQGSANLKEEAEWRGLQKIRETLIDAAGRPVDDIVRQWAWHDGLEAPPSTNISRSPTPEPSIGSRTDSFVDLSGEAIQIRQLESNRTSPVKCAAVEEEATPRPVESARFAVHASMPTNNAQTPRRPASASIPNINVSASSYNANNQTARPTTLPPPKRAERISPEKQTVQPQPRTASFTSFLTGSSSGSASGKPAVSAGMPRKLMLNPSASTSTPHSNIASAAGSSSSISPTPPVSAPVRNRQSLSERLSAASRPSSASASPSSLVQATLPEAGGDAAGSSDPLAGMGVSTGIGTGLGRPARKGGDVVHDPLGAGI